MHFVFVCVINYDVEAVLFSRDKIKFDEILLTLRRLVQMRDVYLIHSVHCAIESVLKTVGCTTWVGNNFTVPGTSLVRIDLSAPSTT